MTKRLVIECVIGLVLGAMLGYGFLQVVASVAERANNAVIVIEQEHEVSK
jgi:hypothetical protein